MIEQDFSIVDEILDSAVQNDSYRFNKATEGFTWVDIVMSISETPTKTFSRDYMLGPEFSSVRKYSARLIRGLGVNSVQNVKGLLESIDDAQISGMHQDILQPFIKLSEVVKGYGEIHRENGFERLEGRVPNLYRIPLTQSLMEGYYLSKEIVEGYLRKYSEKEIEKGFTQLSDVNTASKSAYNFIRRVYRESLTELPNSFYERFKYKEGFTFTAEEDIRLPSGSTGLVVKDLYKETNLLGYFCYYLTHVTGPFKAFRKVDYENSLNDFFSDNSTSAADKTIMFNSLNEIINKEFKEETLNFVVENIDRDFYIFKLYLMYYTGVDKQVKLYS